MQTKAPLAFDPEAAASGIRGGCRLAPPGEGRHAPTCCTAMLTGGEDDEEEDAEAEAAAATESDRAFRLRSAFLSCRACSCACSKSNVTSGRAGEEDEDAAAAAAGGWAAFLFEDEPFLPMISGEGSKLATQQTVTQARAVWRAWMHEGQQTMGHRSEAARARRSGRGTPGHRGIGAAESKRNPNNNEQSKE